MRTSGRNLAQPFGSCHDVQAYLCNLIPTHLLFEPFRLASSSLVSAVCLTSFVIVIHKRTCGLGTVSDPGDRNENVVREIYWMGQVPLARTYRGRCWWCLVCVRGQHPLTTSGGLSAINAAYYR